MSDVSVVQVPERGHQEIELDIWQRLSGRPEFWRLVADKRLAVAQLSQSRYRLDGQAYVGRVLLPGVRVEVVEKIPGSLRSLFSYASGGAFKIADVPAQSTELGDLVSLLIDQFLTLIRGYIASGREAVYRTRTSTGSLVAGRLDVTSTLGLRARGLGHIARFHRPELTRVTPFNQVMYAALHEIGRIARIMDIPMPLLALARSMSLVFDDCRAGVLFASRESLARSIDALLANAMYRRQADMLSLAGVLLSHESFEMDSPVPGTTPRAWFLNLETLFEQAIRRVTTNVLPSAIVRAGSEIAPPIFTNTLRFSANPDLFIEGMDIPLVGDAKYKDWVGLASSADLYELLVHASAFGASKAFLVFPHNSFEAVDLGESANGIHTWIFAVDVTDLRTSVEQMYSTLGLSHSASVGSSA